MSDEEIIEIYNDYRQFDETYKIGDTLLLRMTMKYTGHQDPPHLTFIACQIFLEYMRRNIKQ